MATRRHCLIYVIHHKVLSYSLLFILIYNKVYLHFCLLCFLFIIIYLLSCQPYYFLFLLFYSLTFISLFYTFLWGGVEFSQGNAMGRVAGIRATGNLGGCWLSTWQTLREKLIVAPNLSKFTFPVSILTLVFKT